MRVDVYASYVEETKADDNTTTENSVRKNFRNLTMEDAKSKVTDFLNNIPENATSFYMEVHKSYNDQMDAALSSI